jgi:hypothetical protein
MPYTHTSECRTLRSSGRNGRNVLVSLFVHVSHFYIEFYPFSSHFLIVSVFVVYFPHYHRFGTRDLVMTPCAWSISIGTLGPPHEFGVPSGA